VEKKRKGKKKEKCEKKINEELEFVSNFVV
jgi:hypothetical protein